MSDITPSVLKNISSSNTPHQTKLQSMKKGGNGASRKDQLMADREAYLQLLITQLKNQNPNNPTDTDRMTQQIVSISQAEQAITTNEHLDKLVKMQEDEHRAAAINYIGKVIGYDTSDQEYGGSPIKFQYDIKSNAESLNIKIKNDQNIAVKTIKSNTEDRQKGLHELKWDGFTDLGQRAPYGKYRVEIEALDGNGSPIYYETNAKSYVKSIYEFFGSTMLELDNGTEIPLNKVKAVSMPEQKSISSLDKETKDKIMSSISQINSVQENLSDEEKQKKALEQMLNFN